LKIKSNVRKRSPYINNSICRAKYRSLVNFRELIVAVYKRSESTLTCERRWICPRRIFCPPQLAITYYKQNQWHFIVRAVTNTIQRYKERLINQQKSLPAYPKGFSILYNLFIEEQFSHLRLIYCFVLKNKNTFR
jgi:hypothetical protein